MTIRYIKPPLFWSSKYTPEAPYKPGPKNTLSYAINIKIYNYIPEISKHSHKIYNKTKRRKEKNYSIVINDIMEII